MRHKQEQKPPNIFIIKKNAIDPGSAFFYSLGCSFIHFSMCVTIFFIDWPDINNAIKFDKEFDEILK